MSSTSDSIPAFVRYTPSLFRKKSGPALRAALPYVHELYHGPQDCSGARQVTDSSAAFRAREVGSLLHLRLHTVPHGGAALVIRVAAICVVALLWGMLTSSALKLRCVASASLYSLAESGFTFGERGTSFTSFSQFVGVVLYAPLLLDVYGALAGPPLLYVICFPLNVWLLEVVIGGVLTWVHGFNVAWCYADYADTFAWEQARLGHAPAWLALGGGCNLLYPLAIAASERHAVAGGLQWWWALLLLGTAAATWRLLVPPVAVPTVCCHPVSKPALVCVAIGATRGFRPTWWLQWGHLQTAYYGLNLQGHTLATPIEEERWLTEDGGTVQLVWPHCEPTLVSADSPVVLILPGLGGTAKGSGEAAAMMLEARIRPVVFEPRGLSGLPLTSPRVNLFGSTDDLREAIRHVQARFPAAPLALLATSAGTATAARYLGEEGSRSPLVAAVLNCPGFDIGVSCTRCSKLFDGPHYVKSIQAKVLNGQSGRLLEQAKPQAYRRAASAHNLHELMVHLSPFAGPALRQEPPRVRGNGVQAAVEEAAEAEPAEWDFASYLRHCNPMGPVRDVKTPLLILNADDDPICTVANVRDHLEDIRSVESAVLLQLPKGGHCGFYTGAWRPRHWGLAMAAKFIASYVSEERLGRCTAPPQASSSSASMAAVGKRATRSPARRTR